MEDGPAHLNAQAQGAGQGACNHACPQPFFERHSSAQVGRQRQRGQDLSKLYLRGSRSRHCHTLSVEPIGFNPHQVPGPPPGRDVQPGMGNAAVVAPRIRAWGTRDVRSILRLHGQP
jgi:hypothetical protein